MPSDLVSRRWKTGCFRTSEYCLVRLARQARQTGKSNFEQFRITLLALARSDMRGVSSV